MSQPFHKTIVPTIKRCHPSPSKSSILEFLALISETDIPAGHDEIMAAINDYFNFPGSNKWAKDFNKVKSHIAAQKKLAEARSCSTVGEIRTIVEKIIELLKETKKNRETSLIRIRFRQLDRGWSRLIAE